MSAATALKLVDQTSSFETLRETTLRLVSEKVTAREILEARVRREVAEFNQERGDIFHGLVQPTDAERRLNGYKLKKKRRIDADAQLDLAFKAFESNGFLMLADDRQVESLDEEIVVMEKTTITFIQLVPLVGG